jgi:hypothetical protein
MEISVSKKAITWLPVVVGMWLVVMKMRERGSMRIAHHHWEV